MGEANSFLGGFVTGTLFFTLLLLVQKYLWCLRKSPRVGIAPTSREFSLANPYILTLIVRTDLQLVKSKMATHCSHAAVMAYDDLLSRDPQAARFWLYTGQTKILVAADTVDVINKMDDLARRLSLKTTFVSDDRISLIGPTMVTVMCIGPGPQNVIHRITHDLRLL